MAKPDLGEATWVGAFLLVAGSAASIFGAAALLFKEPLLQLGIAAGSGWSIAMVLFVVNGQQRRRIANLEVDLAEAKNQAAEWSGTARSAADAAKATTEFFGTIMTSSAARAAPSRARAGAKGK